jgi:formate-dependent nitrite reductase membrane component NrfD
MGLTPPPPPFQYPVSWGPDMPPDHQAIWGAKVALAYFFIGLGSMLAVITAANDVRVAVPTTGGGTESIRDIARFKFSVGAVSLIALILGLVFLVLDAGKPSTAWQIITYGLEYGRWESWMFLGTIFLIVLFILDIAYSVIWLGNMRPNFLSMLFNKISSWYVVKGKMYSMRYFLIGIMIIFGILGASYGGVLFSQTNIGLWRNPTIILLFPVSGLSSAAATGLLLTLIIKDPGVRDTNLLLWSKIDLYAEASEAILTALFLYIGYISTYASESVYQVLFGRYSIYFWVLVVTLGIAIPMLLELALHKVNPRYYKYIIPFVTLLVLIGAVSLRYYVVIASAYFYPPLSPFSPTQMQFPWGTCWGE